MNEKKYEVYIGTLKISENMTLDAALCLVRGWAINHNDKILEITIKETEKPRLHKDN